MHQKGCKPALSHLPTAGNWCQRTAKFLWSLEMQFTVLLEEFQAAQATKRSVKNHACTLRRPQILRYVQAILSNIICILRFLKLKSSLLALGRKYITVFRHFSSFCVILKDTLPLGFNLIILISFHILAIHSIS